MLKFCSCFQSKLREVERKINLENAQYEELMLELSLKKKEVTKTNGFAPKDQQEFVDTSRKGRWRENLVKFLRYLNIYIIS